jgi:hypothetical protein
MFIEGHLVSGGEKAMGEREREVRRGYRSRQMWGGITITFYFQESSNDFQHARVCDTFIRFELIDHTSLGTINPIKPYSHENVAAQLQRHDPPRFGGGGEAVWIRVHLQLEFPAAPPLVLLREDCEAIFINQ